MLRSNKISLAPHQGMYFAKARGRVRFGWNLTDAVWNEEFAAQRRGVTLSAVDRLFTNSKTCSACGAVNERMTSVGGRWLCICGAEDDRDANVAKNLLKRSIAEGTKKAVASPEKISWGGWPVAACGDEGSGRGRKTTVKEGSAKQEVKAWAGVRVRRCATPQVLQ